MRKVSAVAMPATSATAPTAVASNVFLSVIFVLPCFHYVCEGTLRALWLLPRGRQEFFETYGFRVTEHLSGGTLLLDQTLVQKNDL